jgi:hypothetical protein
MRRTHPPPDRPTPPASPARVEPMTILPAQLQPLWALAVAIAESAAEIAATRLIPSWRASAYLYAAADQAWGADGGGGAGGWRADRSEPGGEFRFAVLLAEAATARFVAGDGYLSNRQLATDLRSGAAWLATGALLQRGP